MEVTTKKMFDLAFANIYISYGPMIVFLRILFPSSLAPQESC